MDLSTGISELSEHKFLEGILVDAFSKKIHDYFRSNCLQHILKRKCIIQSSVCLFIGTSTDLNSHYRFQEGQTERNNFKDQVLE